MRLNELPKPKNRKERRVLRNMRKFVQRRPDITVPEVKKI